MTSNASAPPSDASSSTEASPVTALTHAVRGWKGVSLAPHRIQAVQFRLNDKAFGHVYPGGVLDIPFPRPVRDRLVEAGEATAHRYLPESGWVTFRMMGAEDVQKATYLLRLSYLYRRLLRTRTAAALDRIGHELDALLVPPPVRAVFDKALAKRAAGAPEDDLPPGFKRSLTKRDTGE